MKILDKYFFSKLPFNYICKSYTFADEGIKISSITLKCTNEERIRYQHTQLDNEVILEVDEILRNNVDKIFVIKKEKTIEINYIVNNLSIDKIININDLDYDMHYIFVDNIYYIKKIDDLLIEICFKNNERIMLNVDFDKILVLYERTLLSVDNVSIVATKKHL